MYVLIGCRHPLIRYWQPLGGKTTATCSLPYPENECQQSINNFMYYIFGNQAILQIFTHISDLLTTLIGKETIYQR
jgi:hypothetical protein